jgi:alpha-1,2-glucosyltransferase
VVLVCLAFFVWNKGVAVGDRSRHTLGFNITNLAYLLLCAWLVFLPTNIHALPQVLTFIRRPLVAILVFVGFVVYMSTYANNHPFNGSGLRFYLHNEGLYWLTKSVWVRAIAFVFMGWMVLTICVIRLPTPRFGLSYLFATLSAGLHPLIEQRYYLPALTLFQIWRPALPRQWEMAALAYYVAVALVVLIGITSQRFFL